MKYSKVFFPCLLLVGLISSCSQDDVIDSREEVKENTEVTNPDEIKTCLEKLDLPKGVRRVSEKNDPNDGIPIAVGEEEVTQEPEELDGIPGYWITSSRRYRMSQVYDEAILFDPTIDMLYPGCALRGNSIADGTYAMLTDYELGDISFSINLVPNNPIDNEKISRTIPNIRKSDYQKVLNEWSDIDFKENAVTTLESIERITSQSELVTKLGATVRTSAVDAAMNFNFNFTKKKNHVLAKIIQKGFSVSTDAPRNTPTIFKKVDTKYLEGVQPVYVSNINYGRILYLCIDTDEKVEDVNAALNFAIHHLEVPVELYTKYMNILSSSDIHITMLGVGESVQRDVLRGGVDALQKFIEAPMLMHQLHPISFSLRYASDNAQARIVTSNEFTITQRNFVQDFSKVRLNLRVKGFSGKNEGPLPNLDKQSKLYGKIWVEANGLETQLHEIFSTSPFTFPYRGEEKFNPIGNGGYFTIDLERKPGQDVKSFIDTQKVTFFADLYNAGPYNRSYGKTSLTHTLGTLYSIFLSGDPVFILESVNNTVKIKTYIEIQDMSLYR
ncbi:MAG: thiol-activated cytolysin family protein [Prevotella sp.]|nr:thiol-activated cytolysin family protein [Prevotella sp.]